MKSVEPGRKDLLPRNFNLTALSLAMLAAWPCLSQAQSPPQPAVEAPASAAAPSEEVQEIVVTGVLRDTLERKAPVAITTIDENRIRQVVPVSAADLLSEIPGVIVNSDAGETRNVVYTRGLSVGTGSSTTGYYWTTILEDGLPTIGAGFSNFQPDMFLRTDATTKSVQAVRGGSAAVTGPNAPGGLFNYISKTGLTDPGGVIGARLGLEGDSNLYQKYDAYYGARNSEKTLGASIGGNWRRSIGYRELPYPNNSGGQIKANVNALYDSAFGKGGVLLTFKHLNDHTANYDNYRQIAHGFGPVAFDTPFGLTANFEPTNRDLVHSSYFGDNGEEKVWDPSNYSHEKSYVFGAKWNHNFPGDWSLVNNFRVQRNQVDHTYVNNIATLSVTNATTFANLGINAAGLNNTPGYYEIRNRQNGDSLARIDQRQGACPTALCINPSVTNLLPNQSLEGNAPLSNNNLALTLGGESLLIRSDDYIDLLTLTKRFDKVTVTAGAYMAFIHFTRDASNPGRGIMGLENNPDPYSVVFKPATGTKSDGSPLEYQLTSPSGFGAIGSSGLNLRDDTNTQEISPLLGITWEPTARLLLDAGAKYTMYKFDGLNKRFQVNSRATDRTFGGWDGNEYTLYDNVYSVESEDFNIPYKKKVEFLQYTGAVSYLINAKTTAYMRYSVGRKNSDALWNGFDTQLKPDQTDITIQPILKQYELALKYRGKTFSLNPTFYFTDLNQVPVMVNNALRSNGVTTYTTPPAYQHFQTYGLELDARLKVNRWVGLHHVLTLNHARALTLSAWNLGACNGIPNNTTCTSDMPAYTDTSLDDVAVYTHDRFQERSARVQYMGNIDFKIGDFGAYYRFRYTGKRPINATGLAYIPASSLSDVGLSYRPTKKLDLSFNVNNIFNDRNPQDIGALGTMTEAMPLDQFIALYPNALTAVRVNPPRSYFFSATARF